MSSNSSRGTRHIFDGTGVYIALFLVVTALAVAGYWTLIPHSPADAPVVDAAPSAAAPAAPITVAPKPAEPRVTPPPAAPKPAPEAEPAAPAQSAVHITLPDTEPVDLTPAPPSLVVPPLVGETLAAFSMEALAYDETMGDWRTHSGVDIAAEPGTPVCAASAGTVTDVRSDDLLGTSVTLAHDGGFETVYANLESEPPVEPGDFVTAGQPIGAVGKTALGESALAPHLHFSVVKDGEFVDPAAFLD